jgi:DNA-binding beta-propeller fold protein YncE
MHAQHAVRSLRVEHAFALFWLGLVAWALLGGGGGCSAPPPPPPDPHEPAGFQTFTSPQVNPIVLSPDRAWVYVANTTSNSVSFIRTSNFNIPYTVPAGVEPVSLAVRPDGLELWVSNHVSDSVSVIDTDPASASYGHVIETIQPLDAKGVAELDEPVGIAFASNSKAYVASSSRNRIAVVDATSYSVTGFIEITAQEPRAIAVRNGNLYVAAFESGNRSQLSACITKDTVVTPTSLCSLGLSELQAFATNPNLPGELKNVITRVNIPDRDVFVFSTANETLLSTATGVGTLLYGLAVAADGTIYVSQTDARNLLNGSDGQVLADLDGRMFDNEIAQLTCSGATCTSVATNLEPGNPTVTTHANSLATPYGIALSGDDATLLITAAGVNRLASYDTTTMTQLDVLDVGAIPKGVAFDAPNSPSGTAYVLNSLGNSVSKVSVDANGVLALVATKTVGNDPTPAAVRNGAIAFNSAFASTTGSHSCGSCHPDSNTDQLLWRIGGNCAAIGCGDGDEPRTTMPIRGLKNTLPLHWDGTLGDPFGGGNGAVGLAGNGGTSCTLGDGDGDHDCFLNLVEGSLAGVMCDQIGTCPNTGLTAQQQDDMATFLASVSYPPARARRVDDTLSDDSDTADLNGIATSARQGFADFFTDVGGNGGTTRTCADANGGCHALPLGTATNSATLNGFDSPTMRGLTDRFLQFSLGTTAAIGIQGFATTIPPGNGVTPLEPQIAWDPSTGFQEVTTFGTAFLIFEPVYGMRPPNLFQMFEEASTGHSGALGRQLTLNTTTAPLPATQALLTELQDADARGVVNLRGRALRSGAAVSLSYNALAGNYIVASGSETLSPAALLAEAQAGTTLATLTANLRSGVTNALQPLLSTATTATIGNGRLGDPPLPNLTSGSPPFDLQGVDVSSSATVFVNGQPVGATLTCLTGSTSGFCNPGDVRITLAARPTPNGLHMLQVQNPSGLLSNEIPICASTGTSNTALAVCIAD